MRRIPLILLLLTTPAAAQSPILQALRDNAWPLAAALAAANPDPLARKLVTFIRLLNPNQASAAEIARFIADNPTWPDQPALQRRYAEALADEPDAHAAAALCHAHTPQSAPALVRCAEAYALQPDQPEAAHTARLAWIAGLNAPAQAGAFLSRWAAVLTPADEIARFEHLEAADQAAAARQLPRLPSAARALATARLAFRLNDPDALATLADIPAAARGDPALLLAEARFLRHSHADQAALALWRTALPEAEAATPPARRGPFWSERDGLARRLLSQNDDTGTAAAYALANDIALPPEQAVDADFLAGWIALRKLHDPAKARAHFTTLAAISRSAITQARAYYWLARATPDPAAAHLAYTRAAAWPLTYYGQLAARTDGITPAVLSARIAAQRDPQPNPAEQAIFDASVPARAAIILAAWDDPRRGADFLLQAVQPPASLATRAMAATLARHLQMDDVAVQAARLAGRDGTVLPQSGWPDPVQPPTSAVPATLTLGLIRQESSFDPLIVSGAGAHGLMQLMPGTAQQIARTQHIPAGPLTDPAINMQLGTAYLASLLAQFHDATPYAVAAYNAGPHRVQDWIATNGDASNDADALVDWIELIPFTETRNYVQRVLENEAVYAARTSG